MENQEAEAPKLPSWAVVSEEVAEDAFCAWANAMGLSSKFDPVMLSSDEVKELKAAKSPVIRALMDGSLVVNSSGDFVFTPHDVGKDKLLGAITFSEPKMADIRDATKKDNKVESQVLLMSKMTGKPEVNLINMRNRNSSVCNAIVGLFLG